jgi:excisionase family DNA binding protein
LEWELLTRGIHARATRSGQRPGQRIRADQLSGRPAKRENPRGYRHLSVEQVAEHVGVCPETARRAIRAGHLRAWRPGPGDQGKLLIAADVVEQWRQKRTVRAPTPPLESAAAPESRRLPTRPSTPVSRFHRKLRRAA